MVLTSYNYSLANDFPNQAVDVGTLDAEIRNDSTITTELNGVNWQVGTDNVEIIFEDALSAPEVTALNTLVGNHQGQPLIDTEQRATQLAQVENSTSTWQAGLSLAPGAVRGGLWEIGWHCEFDLDASDFNTNSGYTSAGQARLRVDGVVRSTDTWMLDQPHVFSGKALIQYDDGDQPTLQLEVRKIGVTATCRIRNCQLTLSPPAEF